MLKSTVSQSRKLYHHNCKKVEISGFYIAVRVSFYVARMILSGLVLSNFKLHHGPVVTTTVRNWQQHRHMDSRKE